MALIGMGCGRGFEKMIVSYQRPTSTRCSGHMRQYLVRRNRQKSLLSVYRNLPAVGFSDRKTAQEEIDIVDPTLVGPIGECK
jgi:hypothetical protein